MTRSPHLPADSRDPHSDDCALLARVRSGDTEAYAALYDAHHHAALRVAIAVAGPCRAEDLVAEAFTRTLQLLLTGRGPDRRFRAYLFAAIRNTHVNGLRQGARLTHVGDITEVDRPDPGHAVLPTSLENDLVADAMQALPTRWQQVLWLTVVEERPLDEVSEILGCSPNAVAQLAFRAREALRLSYLVQHVERPVGPSCSTVVPLLARQARDGSTRHRTRLVAHLGGCGRCRRAHAELAEVAGTLVPRRAAA